MRMERWCCSIIAGPSSFGSGGHSCAPQRPYLLSWKHKYDLRSYRCRPRRPGLSKSPATLSSWSPLVVFNPTTSDQSAIIPQMSSHSPSPSTFFAVVASRLHRRNRTDDRFGILSTSPSDYVLPACPFSAPVVPLLRPLGPAAPPPLFFCAPLSGLRVLSFDDYYWRKLVHFPATTTKLCGVVSIFHPHGRHFFSLSFDPPEAVVVLLLVAWNISM